MNRFVVVIVETQLWRERKKVSKTEYDDKVWETTIRERGKSQRQRREWEKWEN